MATNGIVQMDQKAHAKTYSGFISVMKIGSVVAAIATAVVVYLIAR